MADMMSCEGKITTLECMDCGYREVFSERQFQCTDGLRCHKCEGFVKPSRTKSGEKVNNRRMKKQGNTRSIGTISVDLDCSEALKGLKGVQREAKKAAQALKEVEEYQRNATKAQKYDAIMKALSKYTPEEIEYYKCEHVLFEVAHDVQQNN